MSKEIVKCLVCDKKNRVEDAAVDWFEVDWYDKDTGKKKEEKGVVCAECYADWYIVHDR